MGDPDMSELERRFTLVAVELRAKDDAMRIGGYAAVFNRLSQNLGGFVERVAPTFFNKSKGDGWPDVMARYNHDDNMLLGTTGGNTLHLRIDETGLDYEVELPKARADLGELVQRGDVRKSSFAFRLMPTPDGEAGDSWDVTDTGYPMRTLRSGQLVDVAPVNSPAYLDSSAGLRSLAEKFEADVEEVRKLADADELRRFFVRTDRPLLAAKKLTVVDARAMIAKRLEA
jgi:HK97 family phage prohead protease